MAGEIDIFGILNSKTSEAILAKAAQIKDDALGKKQSEINSEHSKKLNTLEQRPQMKQVEFSALDTLDGLEDCGYYTVTILEHNCGSLIVTSDYAAHGILQFLISNYKANNGEVTGEHKDGTFTIVCRYKTLAGSWGKWSYFGINDNVPTELTTFSSKKIKELMYSKDELKNRIMGEIVLTKEINNYSELDEYNSPTQMGKYALMWQERLVGYLNMYLCWGSYLVQELESFMTKTDKVTSTRTVTRFVRSKPMSSGNWTAWVPYQNSFIGENNVEFDDDSTVPSMKMFKELNSKIGWQTAKFNSILDGSEEVDEKEGIPEDLTEDSVFFSPKTNGFVGMKIENLKPKYHAIWHNGDLWNENNLGTARTDVYFIDTEQKQYTFTKDAGLLPTGSIEEGTPIEVVQNTGNSTTAVISQKAVTDLVGQLQVPVGFNSFISEEVKIEIYGSPGTGTKDNMYYYNYGSFHKFIMLHTDGKYYDQFSNQEDYMGDFNNPKTNTRFVDITGENYYYDGSKLVSLGFSNDIKTIFGQYDDSASFTATAKQLIEANMFCAKINVKISEGNYSMVFFTGNLKKENPDDIFPSILVGVSVQGKHYRMVHSSGNNITIEVIA